MIDAVNCEISSEYMDKSMSYFLLIPLHSQTGLSGFRGRLCAVMESQTTLCTQICGGKTVCVKTTVRIKATFEWMSFNSK